jgi:hypothetical protein
VVLAKSGRITSDQIPFFPILWLKGMLLVVVVGVLMAILSHVS